MTPGERMRWVNREILRRRVDVLDAQDALAEAEMEWHYAHFIHVAASEPCPTCQAPVGSYCAIWNRDGVYVTEQYPTGSVRLIALFLHPARTTTPAALAAAL